MLTSPRIMMVSAYGRGNWLAVELKRLGFNVQLVDVTEALGATTAADQEGPFPYFPAPDWIGVEKEALESFGALKENPLGMTLLLKNGPWELAGPTGTYRGEALHQIPDAMEFVKGHFGLDVSRRAIIDRLKVKSFERRWIASLASDWMANQGQSPNEAFKESPPVGLFERCWMRSPEARSNKKSLEWCQKNGVVVVEKASIPDVSVNGRQVEGLEIKAEKSGFARFHHLVWMLSSMETKLLSESVFQKIFKGEALYPVWFWARYELEFQPSPEYSLLPNEFLMIDNIDLPWSHENFVTFRRSSEARVYHVWMRLPFSQRFQREYLTDRIKPVIGALAQHTPRLMAQLRQLPLESEAHEQSLGAPLYPVFKSTEKAIKGAGGFKNLWMSQPESWPTYDWSHIFSSQRQIVAGLRQWWGALSEEDKQKELEL